MKRVEIIAHALMFMCQLAFSGWVSSVISRSSHSLRLQHVLGKKALNEGVKPLIFAAYREITASILMYTMAVIATRGVGMLLRCAACCARCALLALPCQSCFDVPSFVR